jgi:hypothetical protein
MSSITNITNSSGGELANLALDPNLASLPVFARKGWRRVRFEHVVERIHEVTK